MKKVLYSTAVVLTALSISNSANADSTGCGLGTMLFHGNDGAAPNILAVTTNGSLSGNQTFGISSGTLGCGKGKVSSPAGRLFSFADENLNELAADISKGNGEYLTSASTIIGIKENDQKHFFRVMQNNFSNIFANENVKTENVVTAIKGVMQKDEVLKSYKI